MIQDVAHRARYVFKTLKISASTFECPYLSYSKALIFYNGKWDGKFHNQLKLLKFILNTGAHTDNGSGCNAIEVVGAKRWPPSEQ